MNWNEKFLCVKRFRPSGTDGKREELSGQTDKRTAFESDFGRVIFSAACRRLHDKTQVFPLTTNDNIHSRLTHSLEVMNMGLSFSIDLSDNDDFKQQTELNNTDVLRGISAILKTSCIVHDIGNPPFGHFGEKVIQDFFRCLFEQMENGGSDVIRNIEKTDFTTKKERKELPQSEIDALNEKRRNYILENHGNFMGDADWLRDYTEFDGNAEGLRILTKLQHAGDLYGLNLTYATLAATIKYPNTGAADKNAEAIGNHKHGVMRTEKKELEEIADKCGLRSDNGGEFRHPLAFLMEAADSLCYLVMDIDDAMSRKWVRFDDVMELVKTTKQEEKEKILNAYSHIVGDCKSEHKRWMSLRTAILGFLMEVATNNFVHNLSDIEKGKYNHELIEHNCELTKLLQDFTVKRILSQRDINSLETTGRSVISGLLSQYMSLMFHPEKDFRDRAKTLLSKSILRTVIDEHMHDHSEQFKEKYGDVELDTACEKMDLADLTVEERFRVVRDYVAGMTDKFALNHYRELSGQRLS